MTRPEPTASIPGRPAPAHLERAGAGLGGRAALVGWLVLTALFAVSLFKHISYPLLWNDEADTVVFGERVLESGYPTAHDGKNTLYYAPFDMSVGVREPWGAYLYSVGWLKYYCAAIGVFLAGQVGDLYMKTALLRIPFAVIGFAGVVLMGLSVARLFHDGEDRRYYFLCLFALFEITSIYLTLHLREARHYSLMLLLCAGVIHAHIGHIVLRRMNGRVYAVVMVVLLFLLLNTFYPLYFILVATCGLDAGLRLLYRARQQRRALASPLPSLEELKPLIVLAVSALTAIPVLLFFRTFTIMEIVSQQHAGLGYQGLDLYTRNLGIYLEFLMSHEYLGVALLLKAVLLWVGLRARGQGIDPGPATRSRVQTSGFLTGFLIIHLLMIARIPSPWTRYAVILQPVIALTILLDVFVILEFLGLMGLSGWGRRLRVAFVSGLLLVFGVSSGARAGELEGHLYEIFHQYRGPLDFVIPYLAERYEEPSDLVIATNYEEFAYMYYLNSKVIVGYRAANFEETRHEVPDVVVIRKKRSVMTDRLEDFLSKAVYEKVSFPVEDYPVNNIPDLHILRHLYRTPLTNDAASRLDVFIKVDQPVPADSPAAAGWRESHTATVAGFSRREPRT